MKLYPARVASLLAGAAALLSALAPAVANLDTTSTAGALGGAVVILGVLDRFLVGQRAHEAQVAAPVPGPAVPTVWSGSTATTNPGITFSTDPEPPATSTAKPKPKPRPRRPTPTKAADDA